jgi:predicted Holliday junction resolvase-like endonuclease
MPSLKLLQKALSLYKKDNIMTVYTKTKPRWCPTAVATEQGWVNSLNGELLVSHRNLKSKIDAEEASRVQEVAPVVIQEEDIMQVQEEVEVKVTQVEEETIKKPKKNQKLLGEVVEFNIPSDAKVIGE